jgi:hypothetical protein
MVHIINKDNIILLIYINYICLNFLVFYYKISIIISTKFYNARIINKRGYTCTDEVIYKYKYWNIGIIKILISLVT